MGNLMESVKKAQVLVQQETQRMQQELAVAEIEGFSSDETVRVVMSGQQEPKSIDITEEAYSQGQAALERLGRWRSQGSNRTGPCLTHKLAVVAPTPAVRGSCHPHESPYFQQPVHDLTSRRDAPPPAVSEAMKDAHTKSVAHMKEQMKACLAFNAVLCGMQRASTLAVSTTQGMAQRLGLPPGYGGL